MTSLSLERFAGAITPRTGAWPQQGLLRFVRQQRAVLASSFRVARAYERADTVAARREVLDRFTVHLRG